MVLLHLIRHGETDWNRERRVQGWSGASLNEVGRRQAQDAAPRFAALTPRPTAVLSSDLPRASETAGILAAELGLAAPALFASLRERSNGDAEGMMADDVVARYGDWATSDIPGAETWEALRARAVEAIREVTAHLETTAPAAASVLVVTHGAFLRELVRHITDGRLPHPATRLDNLAGIRVAVEPDRMLLLGASPDG